MTAEPFHSAYSGLEAPLRDAERAALIALQLVRDVGVGEERPDDDEIDLIVFAIRSFHERIEGLVRQWEGGFKTANNIGAKQ